VKNGVKNQSRPSRETHDKPASKPLTVDDVRNIPGYENYSDEMAQNLIMELEKIAHILVNLALYGNK